MAHHKSALKRIQLSEISRQKNRFYKARMKTAVKNVLATDSKENGAKALVAAYSIIDKLAIKGIIPKNRAANKKARLARHVNALG